MLYTKRGFYLIHEATPIIINITSVIHTHLAFGQIFLITFNFSPKITVVKFGKAFCLHFNEKVQPST